MRSQAPLLGKAEDWKSLAEKLSSLERVRRHDDADHNEAWTLAHAFADLEESSRKFLDVQLPKLVANDLTGEERLDLLFEIGEELRHILYHIRDPRFYKYLGEESSADS